MCRAGRSWLPAAWHTSSVSSVSQLPDDGEPTVGGVCLPRGRRLTDGGRSEPVIWASDSYLESPGPPWATLQEPAQRIGLIPVILDDLGGQGPTGRPWESGELDGMSDTRLEDFDDGEVFRKRWNIYVPVGSLPEADRPPDPWAKFGLPAPPFSVEEDPKRRPTSWSRSLLGGCSFQV